MPSCAVSTAESMSTATSGTSTLLEVDRPTRIAGQTHELIHGHSSGQNRPHSMESTAPIGLPDVLRMGFAHLCDPEDALCCALVSVACRDAIHELYPSLVRQAGIHHRSAAHNFSFQHSRCSMRALTCALPFCKSNWHALGADGLPGGCRPHRRHGCLRIACRGGAATLPSDTEHAPAKVCRAAAFGGHVDVLQLVHSKGFRWDASCCAAAAQAGDLSTLRWLLRHGCPWDKATTSRAAIEGHTEVLNWARQHGCEYSEGDHPAHEDGHAAARHELGCSVHVRVVAHHHYFKRRGH